MSSAKMEMLSEKQALSMMLIILLKILMVSIMNGGIFILLDFQMNIKLVYIELDRQLENYLIKEGILNV
jgi:hypothetical protein